MRDAFKGLRLAMGDGCRRSEPLDVSLDAAFCGVCIALPADDAALDRLCEFVRELGLRSLRFDLSYGMDLEMVDRLFDSLSKLDTRILLHLVQPLSLAKRMPDTAVLEQWRVFVVDSLERYVDHIEAVEIGTTVNRAKWAGYNLAGLLALWEVAYAEARRLNLLLVGPNVTDFEPQYNAGLLRCCAVANCRMCIVIIWLRECAIGPEAMDRKIIGERFKRLHGYDLIKKAQLIGALGAAKGVPRTWSTCAFWTLPRIKRVLTASEDKMIICCAILCSVLPRVLSSVFTGDRW